MENIYNAIQNLYNMDKTTWQEVLAELYNLVSKVENKFDLFELKFGQLLGEQVTRELKKMYDDGRLGSLINDVLLKDINAKVDTFKIEVSEQLDTKANLNSIFTMANMGQDIKEAMTGGSVAVVGENTVLTQNVVDKQITVEKTEFLKPYNNIFNNKYNFGVSLTGNNTQGGNVVFSDDIKKVSAIVKIQPRKTYTIIKESSERFRIATTSKYPVNNMSVDRYIKDETVSSTQSVLNENSSYFTFTTNDTENYLIVYVSVSLSETPKMNIVEGSEEIKMENYIISSYYPIDDKILISSPEAFGAKGDGITDDTQAITDYCNSSRKLIFPKGKKYKISSPIKINADIVRYLNGGNSTFIATGDFDVFQFYGSLSGSANPDVSKDIVYTEHGSVIENVIVTSESKVDGTGISISKNFGGIIRNCNFNFLKTGIKIHGMNRNLVISNNHIYANFEHGVYLTDTCDLHQFIISNNHISYCKCNLFVNNSNLYNVIISNNDIETNTTENITPISNIYLYSKTGLMEDIKFVGNTLECHFKVDSHIKLQADIVGNIETINITGNVIGNSSNCDIDIDGARNIIIANNNLKRSRNHSIIVKKSVDCLTIQGNNFTTEPAMGGGIFKVDDTTINLSSVLITNNNLSGGRSNAIDLNVNQLEMVRIDGNLIKEINTTTLDIEKGIINIKANNYNLGSVSNNIIHGKDTMSKSIVINTSTNKVISKNNISNGFSGNSQYDYNASVISDNNI